VSVSADGRHFFRKPTQREILLVEGHGIEGDVRACAFVRHR
jgi:hypothetical protein